ncbi:helix-turn-helix domain-containing protein [Rhizobium sp. K102]|uniref:helix-turn-helix transcriptional regulator n=1 Tax=Rhizobium sp. K102 TaxID=2918527 RepID=UPI001EFB5DB2|nr:helix-turn-helix domain-containing protein [Rhizobium sp. K102]ULR46105.1 helix-turn-helix domain-containing protein [Rhizobium sp. K102]
MAKQFITRPQVRTRYNISDMTISRWIRAGRLPEPAQFAHRHYFDEDELDEADRRAKAEYRRARAEPPKHLPPHLQNNSK